MFLKLFNNVSIRSLNKEIKFNIKDILIEERNEIIEMTSTTLLNPKERIDINFDSLKISIKDHFLPYFHFMRDKPKVNITVYQKHKNETTKLFIIDSKAIPKFQEYSFKLKDNESTLYYLLSHYKKPCVNGFYCANNRVVIKNNTDKKKKIELPSSANILFLLTSPFLDKKVNEARDDFEIYPKKMGTMFDIPWETLQADLRNHIVGIFENNGIFFSDIAKKQLDQAVEKAPYLANYLTTNELASDHEELVKKAKSELEKDKEIVRLKQNINSESYQNKLVKTTQTELAEYIYDRQNIIDSLKKAIENKGKENIIHDLFMPQHTQDDQQNYKSNNLWLFDDRFMIYDKVFSDKQIKEMFPKLHKNLDRPDILSIVSNTYNKESVTDIVIIEFKAPSNKITPSGAEEQLLKYARHVNDDLNEIKEHNVRVWTYAFLAFNNETLNALNDKDYNVIPTQSQYPICYKYFEKNNNIINFMDYSALADDANTRNKTFMNILKGGH